MASSKQVSIHVGGLKGRFSVAEGSGSCFVPEVDVSAVKEIRALMLLLISDKMDSQYYLGLRCQQRSQQLCRAVIENQATPSDQSESKSAVAKDKNIISR